MKSAGGLLFSSARKTTLRGHGSFVGGEANDMPPPPIVVGATRRRVLSAAGKETRGLGKKSPTIPS